jgi:hypothetical protein
MRFRLKLELEIIYPQLRIHEIYSVVLVRTIKKSRTFIMNKLGYANWRGGHPQESENARSLDREGWNQFDGLHLPSLALAAAALTDHPVRIYVVAKREDIAQAAQITTNVPCGND